MKKITRILTLIFINIVFFACESDLLNKPPVAVAGEDIGCYVNESVVFDGSESMDPENSELNFQWDFGNGNIIEGQTVEFSFSAPSVYMVVLIVTDEMGRKDADSIKVYVYDQPVSGHEPVPVITASNGGAVAEDLWFDAHSSQDPDGDDLTYTWDFGDGETGTGIEVSHSYSTRGFYTVTLTAVDPGGLSAVDTAVMNIEADDINQAPYAHALADIVGTVGQDLWFGGHWSSDPDGDDLTYTWDFDDGSSAAGIAVLHSWSSSGVYDVVLTVSDPSGLSDTFSIEVEISDI